ncbi:hypothetical protein Q3G72_006942 [Acer saccharum]|nr:hypothetical protein Q3G72_006942 [Acer saccharum]
MLDSREAFVSSTEEDKATCCFCSCVSDVNPQPFDPKNHLQQFKIIPKRRRGYFTAKSVNPDSYPPTFLRRKGWNLVTKTAHNLELQEAPGLDMELRSRLPDFDNFSLSNKQSSKPVIIGKWYIPFIFIKEGTLKDQMTRSMYYETTLEQRWEQIFECDNNNGHNKDNVVAVDVSIEREVVSLFGGDQKETPVMMSDHDHHERRVVDGVMWFKSSRSDVGLRSEIIERMNWEEERFGWVRGNERKVSVKREEQFGGGSVHGWKKFGWYVLAERFVLKRMDGSLLLTYDFKHTHHIRCEGSSVSYNKVVFIPVLNQPLSSNLYYAIQPRGSHIGEAFESSTEEDKATCCFCSFVSDVNPKPFDPKNHFQQFEIIPKKTRGYFTAKSVDSDSFPPTFLRRKGWNLVTKTAHNLELQEAPGLDMELRSRHNLHNLH